MPALLDHPSFENRRKPRSWFRWVNRMLKQEESTPEYQELKFTLHRKLLDRINLEALSSMAGERIRAQVRSSVAQLVESEKEHHSGSWSRKDRHY